MSSWRDHASEAAQDDLDLLVGVALEKAEVALEESGELLPFFVGVKVNGTKTMGAVGDELDAPELVERLEQILRKNRSEYRALAVVKDVTLRGGGSDAIWVDLCHSEGAAIACSLPYELKDGRVIVGQIGAQNRANLFW